MRGLNFSQRRARAGGITLQELGILLGVILVGAGVAWPYLAQERRVQQRQASLNNLRQWGIALNLYLGENQNILPRSGTPESAPRDEQAWFNLLPPYLSQTPLKDLPPEQWPTPKKRSLWINPAARLPEYGRSDAVLFNYGMNAWLSSPDQNIYKIFEVENPGAVIFLTEVEGRDPAARPETVMPRHGDRPPESPGAAAHFLFCDGHIELLPRRSFNADNRATDTNQPSEKLTWIPFVHAPAPH